MNMRWRYVAAVCAVCVCVCVRGEERGDEDADADADGLPDAGLDARPELALHQEESRNLRPRAYSTPPVGAYNALPSGFRPTASLAELAGYQQRQQQQYLQPQEPRPQPQPQPHAALSPHEQHTQEQQHTRGPPRKQQDRRLTQQQQQELLEEEEEEVEAPDRLQTLLQQSKFNCVGKQSGYYADIDINCEVFHYCADSVKHSWICPDGFTFHQVHLICMPPTQDNICQKSAKYHFVNEYLYRPINEEEVQRKPNVTLRYSDRYYPSEVYNDDRYDQDDADDEEEEAPRRAPAPAPAPRPGPAPAPRPQHAPQVFRSAEEVNIPLLQRRPQRPYDFDF